MRRIPVAATIRESYRFAFTQLGAVIALIWVPMLLVTVVGFFSFHRYYNDFIDAMSSGNPALLGPSLLMMLGYLVAALLMYAVMFVAVIQLSQGARSAPALLHFSFGALEWRMFRALLGCAGLLVAVLIPALIAANALVSLAGTKMPGLGATGLMLLLLYGAVLALGARLLLLPAVAVGDTAPVLRRAWLLGSGNFWRLLAVLLAVFGPVALLFASLEVVLTGNASQAMAGDPQVQLLAGIVQARKALPVISGLGFLVSPLMVGLFAGASISAWRALKDEPSVEIIA